MLGPTLNCSLNDSFNVEGINGNGKLKYPIGLITADEVNMAGGITDSANTLYYLYSGETYVTMSPYEFGDWFSDYMFYINKNGTLKRDDVLSYSSVRPVINIDPSKIEFSGNGTMSDPYVLS